AHMATKPILRRIKTLDKPSATENRRRFFYALARPQHKREPAAEEKKNLMSASAPSAPTK
ncbi:MAG: hypothetical protein WCS95_07775, partial [Lentisphaeria bacterium]